MTMSWIKVNGPTDRDVYVGYNFTAAAGRTNTPFQVVRGGNTFILLTPNLIIDARTKAYVPVTDEAHPFVIELWPALSPPPDPIPAAEARP